MASIFMVCAVVGYIAMAYAVTACKGMAYSFMVYLVMAYIVIAYMFMAYIAMTFELRRFDAQQSWRFHSTTFVTFLGLPRSTSHQFPFAAFVCVHDP